MPQNFESAGRKNPGDKPGSHAACMTVPNDHLFFLRSTMA